MATKVKTPVFFIATRIRKNPIKVSFFTRAGKPVDSDDVKRVRTKKGVRLYVKER